MFSPTSLPSLSPERGPSVSQVEAILRYKFEDPKLLEEALTHSSILDAPSYERLEFVGDRVLNLAVSDHLVQAYPELDQGQLSTLLSANVCKEKLAQVALRCKLYKFLGHKMQYSNGQVSEFARAVEEENGGSVEAPKFLEDIVKSVVAAIYYDVGSKLKRFWKIFKGLLEPLVGPEELQQQPEPVNRGFDGPLEIKEAKKKLHNLCGKKKWPLPNYKREVLDPRRARNMLLQLK